MEETHQDTYIQVNTRFFPLAFILLICTPTISIDGEEHSRRWGRHRFDLPPGRHEVEVWFRYLFWEKCGHNTIDVEAVPGAPVEVDFYMPPWMLMAGLIKSGPVEEAAPTGEEADQAAQKTAMIAVAASVAVILVCCCGGALLGLLANM